MFWRHSDKTTQIKILFYMFKFCLILNYSNSRGVLKNPVQHLRRRFLQKLKDFPLLGISSNKRLLSNKRSTSKYGVYKNSYYILLETKSKCLWTQYANNNTMKILLISRFFHNIWFIDSENLCFVLKKQWQSFDIQHCPFP